MKPTAPPLGQIMETGLYVADMDVARHFYESVMGLTPMFADARLTAYPVAQASVLLLFQQGSTEAPAPAFDGVIPPHDGQGRLHYAFAIAEGDLPAWRTHLGSHDVEIEGEVHWPKGSTSVYFRDPDGHLVELATPGLWRNY